jgi:hypothetical protein
LLVKCGRNASRTLLASLSSQMILITKRPKIILRKGTEGQRRVTYIPANAALFPLKAPSADTPNSSRNPSQRGNECRRKLIFFMLCLRTGRLYSGGFISCLAPNHHQAMLYLCVPTGSCSNLAHNFIALNKFRLLILSLFFYLSLGTKADLDKVFS